MPYSRLLKLGDKIEDKLKAHLTTISTQHMAERTSFDNELTQLQEDYDAVPKGKKTFPFENACNLIIPIFAIAFETTHAAIMGTIYGLDTQLIEVSPAAGQYTDFAYHNGAWLNRYLLKCCNIKQDLESSIIEIQKFGTGVARASYEKIVKYGMRDVGGVETPFPVVTKDGLSYKSTPISRFLLPFEAQTPEESTWCGETYKWTPYRIKQAEKAGVFYPGTYEKIKNAITGLSNTTDKFEETQEQLEKRMSTLPSRISFTEFWLCYNVEDEDEEEDYYENQKEIQVFFCQDTNTLMGVFYNQYSDLRKPHRMGVYVKVEHRGFGIGIGKQVDQFQREITIQHRQRIDNATIANIRMFKINKMAGYGPNEPIMAGKFWFLDNMEDLEAFQMGEIYPSSYNNEQQSTLWMQQRVGTNELNQGLPQVGTPGTATSDIARLQESKKKHQYVEDNIKKFHHSLVLDGVDILQTNQIVKYATPTEMQYVQQLMQMPYDDIKNGSIINILMIGSQANKVLDAQKWDSLTPKLQNYYTQMLNLAMMTKDPNIIMQVFKKILVGGNEAMKQILEGADIRNLDMFLLNDLIAKNRIGNNAAIGAGNPATEATQIGSGV